MSDRQVSTYLKEKFNVFEKTSGVKCSKADVQLEVKKSRAQIF